MVVVILGGIMTYCLVKWFQKYQKGVTIIINEVNKEAEEVKFQSLYMKVMLIYSSEIRELVGISEYLVPIAYKTEGGESAVLLKIPNNGKVWFECDFYISGEFSITYANQVSKFENFSEDNDIIRERLIESGVLKATPVVKAVV